MRANSLQELVYKQGQAGITKATVSIVFDNHDKERSPVGYEHFDEIAITRQLVIGGRNKYLINGKVAEPSRVQNLFHSVQLNVNNPHFLIMQGRITKVLNMKPPEILSLLEEAAGTKMYEAKKQVAMRTMEKKQVKVDEINRVLEEDIMPALDKLRREKVAFMEWQSATSNLDRLRRFCVAYRYVESKDLLKTGEADIRAVDAEIAALDATCAAVEGDLREKEDYITGLQTEKELQSGGEVKELIAKADDLAKKLVKDNSACNNKQELLQAEIAFKDQIAAQLMELREEELTARVAAAEASRNNAQALLDAAIAGVSAAEAELAGAETGDGRDASNQSLTERLANAQNAQTEADADLKANETKVKHLSKQLNEHRKILASKEKEGTKFASTIEKERDAVNACRAKLAASGFDPAAYDAAEVEADRARVGVRAARDKVDELASGLSSLDFQYRDPEKGFDRNKVKGVVAKLVHIEDPSVSTALEVAAGGKLYQVVVDSEATAKALLSRGALRNRVTIIPLNKVSSRDIPSSAVSAAKHAVGDKAQAALELVGYDSELSAAMKYVFGGNFICKDSGTAKKLAFAKDVSTRCITLEGDDFNPGGTLTGGSRSKGGSILSKLHELTAAEAELIKQQALLSEAGLKYKSVSKAIAEHKKLAQELELKEHSLSLLEERLAGSEAAQAAAAVSASQAELDEAVEAVSNAQDRKQAMAATAKELAAEIASFSKDKDKRIKISKDKVRSAKSAVEEAKKAVKDTIAALQSSVAEAEAAEAERALLNEQLTAADTAVKDLEAEVERLEQLVASSKAEHAEIAARLEERRARLKECDVEIRAAEKEKSRLESRKADVVIDRKKAVNKLENIRRGFGDASERCRAIEREHPWIASESVHFGKPGGDYDWEANDPSMMFDQFDKASGTIETLGKKVNKKVMAMFEKAEEEYGELKRKRDVVEGDKSRIQVVMDGLDHKKREALEATWRKVNSDFGSIFSTLLPGTAARLEPPEGGTFMDGLEVRVAFGGVWKQSLSELSGGQKSLLALSLILAMLLFKPAPIYILDEVDAALDLSHTQNIGRMIKSHFPQSQFIVVSLKEGMFNNANVIFRTKFVDGVSTVTRTVNESSAIRREEPGKSHAGSGGRAALKENVRS